MRIPLQAGRWFDARDDAERPPVVVINETLAQQHWPDTDPLGRRVSLSVAFRGRTDAEIVGVVGAVRAEGYHSPPRPEVFVPHAQAPDGSMTYVVRTAGDPTAGVPAIQDVVWDNDPIQSFYSVATVEQLLSDTLAARRFTTTLLTLFGVAALVLATLGIYGVIAVATAQRTREIGLRLAMGAEPRHVVGMVVRGAIGLAGTGVSIGLLASLFVSRSLTSLPRRCRALRCRDAGRRVGAAPDRRYRGGLRTGAPGRPRRPSCRPPNGVGGRCFPLRSGTPWQERFRVARGGGVCPSPWSRLE